MMHLCYTVQNSASYNDLPFTRINRVLAGAWTAAFLVVDMAPIGNPAMATEEDSAPVENGHGGIPARDGFSGR